jgi:hypothetical protein
VADPRTPSAIGKHYNLRFALLLAMVATILITSPDVLTRGNAVTVRLDVTSVHLAKPLSITNRSLLDLSNVYGGQFMGELVEGVESDWPRYKVVFVFESRTPLPQLQLTGHQQLYTVEYAIHRQTGEGFVYLPARNEPGWRGNVGIMIRDGDDGRWHKATESWASLLNAYLN